MKKKQGLILIGIIGFIIISYSFSVFIAQTNIKVEKILTKEIIEAAQKYLEKKEKDYPIREGNVYCLLIQDLIDTNNLDKSLIESKINKTIDKMDIVKVEIKKEKDINYKIVKEGKCTPIIKKDELGTLKDISGANKPLLLKGMYFDKKNNN